MSYNPIMVWLLYSPLHWILSGMTMVINYTGRRSGKQYRLPIGYVQSGNALLTVSYKRRKWWRNLRGGTEVTVRLRGKDLNGHSEAIEDEQGVIEGIKAFVECDPRTTRMFGIKLNANGQLETESLLQASTERVIVRTMLL